MTSIARLAVVLAVVAFLIVVYVLAVQIGNSVGHGLTEWNVR